LPVARRPDSQDLCFLGDSDLRQFLVRNAADIEKTGPIITNTGVQIGTHHGLAFYTIGQRKGLGIASQQPLYVIEKDIARNALVVGHVEQLGRQELLTASFNWISGERPEEPFRAAVKIRYKASPAWGLITPLPGGNVHIYFDYPLRDITPGQAAVVYLDDVCIGGGIISLNQE